MAVGSGVVDGSAADARLGKATIASPAPSSVVNISRRKTAAPKVVDVAVSRMATTTVVRRVPAKHHSNVPTSVLPGHARSARIKTLHDLEPLQHYEGVVVDSEIGPDPAPQVIDVVVPEALVGDPERGRSA